MQTTRDIQIPDLSHIFGQKIVKFWDGNKRNYKQHQQELDDAWRTVNESGQLVCGYGGFVEEFEKQFAEFVGKKYAVMTGAGTHSLYLAYKVLDIGSGDEVIVPSNTFIATIDQIHAVGATPILIDCDGDGLMDLSKLKNLITEKTKAIVPVHMEGKSVDQFLTNVFIIEDAAQALGASGAGFGYLQCYSLFPAKILGCMGNAGMITTNEEGIAERLRLMRSNSNIGKNPDLNAEWGTNMEPDNLQAAILSVKMRYLKEWLNWRKTVAEAYLKAFKDLPMRLPSNQGRVWQDFMIQTPDRDQLQAYLLENGVEAIVPNPRIPNHKYKILEGHFPNTDRYIAEKLALPCNQDLTWEEVQKVIETVKKYYGR